MSNQKRLEEYLVGTHGYLKNDVSNGKVIMLSGKWGSGKTHFWKNIIEKDLNDKDKKIPNHYISLYGKTSIQEIKNEVFLKIFEGMDIFKIDDKSVKLAKNTVNLVADLTKTVSVFGVNLDLSKIVDKSFEKLEKVREKQKGEKTKALLNSGAIICFDDFERKSKDIDLNDLFGFITNLTIEFKCKVVIILNDDVFEGEEKKIFSNVKEKSVSKFLKYEPSIEELFNLIFVDESYSKLVEHKEIILKTIEETKELNARIYIQVLNNLVEWIDKKQVLDNDILRCLILVNINFILYHTILNRKNMNHGNNIYSLDKNFIQPYLVLNKSSTFDQYKHELIKKIMSEKEDNFDEKIKLKIKFIDDNLNFHKSVYSSNKLDISKNVADETFQKINNFIETGIL
jgi:hypothetical protein